MSPPVQVTIHPLVLLSVVDHYTRVAKDTKKRVVGVLLGCLSKGELDITNSFAVPFEEDNVDSSIWFMDHSYMENMERMFRKVNARENIVGWYSTGPKIRSADLDIQSLMAKYCNQPVLVICEVQPKEVGLPVHAYITHEEVKPEGTEKAQQVFVHLPTSVAQTEAEEIGVEHLLRDVKDQTISTLSTDVVSKAQALKGLKSRLSEMMDYLQAVLESKLPVNNDVVSLMQDIINLLPNLNVDLLSQSLTVQSNDMMMSIYMAALMRSVVSLHSLIENKETRAWHERKAAKADASARNDAPGATDKSDSKSDDKGAVTDSKSGKGRDGAV